MSAGPAAFSPWRVYWTAFIGLFFDYYDLYLFVYLDKVLAGHFGLSATQSNWLQFTGLAGVGAGALAFGYLADRFGRGRLLLVVFGVYGVGIAALSAAWDYPSLLAARLVASLALGAEWGISHRYLAEQVRGPARYTFSALLQFSILGGLLAALASRYALPLVGWRMLFVLSLVPVGVLACWRWTALSEEAASSEGNEAPGGLGTALRANGGTFLLCLALASLTIASGTMNVFFAKELPQSPWYTVAFWGLVAPGMLGGAWLVRRLGPGRALCVYAVALAALALGCRASGAPGRHLVFALGLPLLNGIPFGLMGALFNEVFGGYRTMLAGAAYNLGRIGAGAAPWLLTAIAAHQGDNYLLFTAALAVGVLGLGVAVMRLKRSG